MSTRRYRKKPVVIDAFQWSGEPADAFEVGRWVISLGVIAERTLPDGRTLQVTRLTYGRARLHIASQMSMELCVYDDEW